jgi:hypothetical protein
MIQNNKLLIGLAGEYFVAGMMNMKGWVASLTLKNYPAVDIFGLNPETDQTINIQVKTTKDKLNYQVGLLRSQRCIIRDKIKAAYVFVHIDKDEKIRYFILSREEIIELIERTDDTYYNKPRLKQLKDYPIGISLKDLLPFENQWDSLWK